MAVKRENLKAMGLNEEQITSIIEMHTETVDGLKEKLKAATAKAEQYDAVKTELDSLKSGNDSWKAKHDALQKTFDAYKNDIAAKETKAAKESAGKAYFEGKGITGANLEIAMRGAKEEISALELADGKIKDTAALDALVAGTYKGLIVTPGTKGADPVNPPANPPGVDYSKMSDEEYYKATYEASKKK